MTLTVAGVGSTARLLTLLYLPTIRPWEIITPVQPDEFTVQYETWGKEMVPTQKFL